MSIHFGKWVIPVLFHLLPLSGGLHAQSFEQPRKVAGYRGIWFTLGQFSEYGDKYSGGLGTYTAKHRPLAVYAPEMNRTFFVYGGTTEEGENHLLAMVSCYDHERGLLPMPTVVHDKQGVNDPHDNPSISLDRMGHLWVFVSGRSTRRPGFVYRSKRPYDIDAFELVLQDTFAYPQPWFTENGFLFLFTRYTGGRELYWRTSPDGRAWGPVKKLVSGGHYEVSGLNGKRVGTAFDVHLPHGNVDARTNLYYLETGDMGRTWRTAAGTRVEVPLEEKDNPALVRDYRSEGRLIYLNDLVFDLEGRPVILYTTSGNFRPGPDGMPRTVTTAHWTGKKWRFSEVTGTFHNYDVGSLYIEENGTWRVVGPYDAGPQHWGCGGEIGMWKSTDEGETWEKTCRVTSGSERNQTYVRRPENAHPDFYFFWADGNPDTMSISRLYFGSRSGGIRRLPYTMENAFVSPEVITEK